MDVLYVNGLTFVTSVSKKLLYHTALFLKSTKVPDIVSAVKDFLRLYNSGGILVQSIDCDNRFRPARNAIMDDCKLQQMNFSNPSEHEPHLERNNRVIQE